ncbi:MAG: hypothetical protein QXV68_04165, partial [Candidatus Caldarchaeum sp.]
PVSISMALIKDKLIVDPLPTEEEIADTLVTVGYDSDGVLSAIQKSSPGLLPVSMFREMVRLGMVKSAEVRKKLEEAVSRGG